MTPFRAGPRTLSAVDPLPRLSELTLKSRHRARRRGIAGEVSQRQVDGVESKTRAEFRRNLAKRPLKSRIGVELRFAENLRFPDDVRDAAPTLLWTMQMGILLYFLYDDSPDEQRTRKLIDSAVDFTVDVKRLATSALLRPLRRKVLRIVDDAGLLAQ